MAKTVVVLTQVAAMNIDALNSDAINTSTNLSNGSVVVRGGLSIVAGKGELFTTSQPATGSLNDLWMVYSPEVTVAQIGDNLFKGLSADPRDFENIKNLPMNIFKPQVGDLITMTGEGITGGLASLTDGQYANAADAVYTLTANAAVGTGLSFKVLNKAKSITIGNEKVAAVLLECVKI